MTDQPTRTKTLWSETQLEMLYLALEKGKADEQVMEILRDLTERGLPGPYLVEKVQAQCGAIAAGRLRRMLKREG